MERAQIAARSPLRRTKQSVFAARGPRFGPSRLPLPPPFFLPSFLYKKVHRISPAIIKFSVHSTRPHHPSQGHRHTPWGHCSHFTSITFSSGQDAHPLCQLYTECTGAFQGVAVHAANSQMVEGWNGTLGLSERGPEPVFLFLREGLFGEFRANASGKQDPMGLLARELFLKDEARRLTCLSSPGWFSARSRSLWKLVGCGKTLLLGSRWG